MRCLQVLQEENGKLRQLVAGLSAGQADAAGCPAKKDLMPAQLRPRAECLQIACGVRAPRACGVLSLIRASHRYWSVADEEADLRMRIREQAKAQIFNRQE